ncbi:hypothetical protein [Paenibacillus sp. DYY-L-2]|uniref:hypothetical protein n=1 Tax=Paenibacillus sp. DYY-L-2 TaxID=3447013 RepID=UPI003F505796
MAKRNRLQWTAGICVLTGGLLFIAATLMHPPATNPWTGNEVIAMVAEMKAYWQFDHALMLLADLLWLGGLAAGAASYEEWRLDREAKVREFPNHVRPLAGLASRLFVAALTMWVLILAMEMTVFPVLSGQWGRISGEFGADALGVGLFAFGIMAGDFAMMLAWIGVSLLGAGLLRTAGDDPRFVHIRRWLAMIGIGCGIWGAVGTPVSLLLPDWSIVLFPLTSGPVFLWTFVLGWKWARGR